MTILHYLFNDSALTASLGDFSTLLLFPLFAVSIAVLVVGARWLVDGVVSLARRTGLSEVAIGATIVSLGTTAPEAFVSVMAAWMGNPGLALGNGVGSIIADTGLIFGIACLVATVPVDRYILNRTGWVQVGAAFLLVLIAGLTALFGSGPPVLGRWVGFLFLGLLVAYLGVTFHWSKERDEPSHQPSAGMGVGRSLFFLFSGLLFIILSSRFLVAVATILASRLGVPDDVVAASMVALGTSLPELVTAITAVRRGHPGVMVGNVVGADVLNVLFVIGASAAARPLSITPTFFTLHFPAMILLLVGFRLFIHRNRSGFFTRGQGAFLFGVYLLYLLLQYLGPFSSIH